jgi:site-specific DNA-methyltransferase (adenine-specific)
MKKQITWSLEKRNTNDLKPSEYNPRTMTESEKSDIENSIDGFGRVVPLVVNTGKRENILIGGHQRLKIYLEKGIVEIDVMIPSRELTLSEEKELNLRLNKNVGSWDFNMLKEMGLDLLLDVGFGDEELQSMFDDVDVIDDDFDIEKAIKETPIARVNTGEIYQLGSHRLLVGSSLDSDLVKDLMSGNYADIVYCDPPYNIGLDYSGGIGGNNNYGGTFSNKDDSKKDAEYSEFIQKSMEVAQSIAKPNAHFFYWCDSRYIWLIQSLYKTQNIDNKRVCLWIKNNASPTPKIAFNKVYEPCIYGVTGKPYLNTNFNNANEVLNQEISSGNQLHDEIHDMIDLWIEKRDSTHAYSHPTQKPVTLNEKPIKRCSAPGHNIFSGFAGSGSDLIACETLKRNWYGVEQDTIFATIIIDRWEKFTNQKAILVYESNK